MKKILMFAIIGIFFFSLAGVSATSIGTYKLNEPMQITNYCQVGTCTYMNLTSLQYPNGTLLNLNAAMTKNVQDFYYPFTPTETGEYTFTTCGDPSGVVCDKDTFEATPNGNSGTNNILLYIVILVLGYTLNLLGFFKRNTTITILGGIVLIFTGLYMIQNGIIIFRDNLTLAISYITLFWGGGSSLWAAIEQIQDSM